QLAKRFKQYSRSTVKPHFIQNPGGKDFIKGNGSIHYPSGSVRHSYHIKITLQFPILSRSAMDNNKTQIRDYPRVSLGETKIILVNQAFAERRNGIPFCFRNDYKRWVKTLFINILEYHIRTL